MKLVLDQKDDFSNKELYTFLRGVDLPEFVKQSEVDDVESVRELPKTAFAAPSFRAFPINTPSRAYVSNAYFVNKKAALEKEWGPKFTAEVEAKIANALKVFGIEKEAAAYAETRKTAEVKERVIFEAKLGDKEIQLYPVKTAQDVAAAADDFAQSISALPMEWRFDIAESIVKAAQEFEVEELPDIVCKYAGMFYPDMEGIKKEMWRRSTKLASQVNKDRYAALIKDCDNISTKEEVKKLATTVYYIEKMEGLYGKEKVAALLPDVVDMFFSVPIEKVAESLDVIKMGNELFKLSDLQKVPQTVYEEAFGMTVDFSKKSEAKDVLETVPLSDVKLFKELSGLKSL